MNPAHRFLLMSSTWRAQSAPDACKLPPPNNSVLLSLCGTSNSGTVESTGKFKQTSTSLSVCMDLSKSAIKYMIASANAKPAPKPAPANYERFGKDGLSGELR